MFWSLYIYIFPPGVWYQGMLCHTSYVTDPVAICLRPIKRLQATIHLIVESSIITVRITYTSSFPFLPVFSGLFRINIDGSDMVCMHLFLVLDLSEHATEDTNQWFKTCIVLQLVKIVYYLRKVYLSKHCIIVVDKCSANCTLFNKHYARRPIFLYFT